MALRTVIILSCHHTYGVLLDPIVLTIVRHYNSKHIKCATPNSQGAIHVMLHAFWTLLECKKMLKIKKISTIISS